MLIAYVSDYEVLVTTSEKDAKFLTEYFSGNTGRMTTADYDSLGDDAPDLDTVALYTRIEIHGNGVKVTPFQSLSVS